MKGEAGTNETAVGATGNVIAGSSTPIGAVALVSRRYDADAPAAQQGTLPLTREEFDAINQFCASEGRNTVVYSCWTWSAAGGEATPNFEACPGLEWVFLEVDYTMIADGERPLGVPAGVVVEVWERGADNPRRATQRFATASDQDSDAQLFVDDVLQGARSFGDGLLAICGEVAIRSPRKASVGSQFFAWLDEQGPAVSTIINPGHTFTTPRCWGWRMSLSGDGRTVVSVWNRPSAGSGKCTGWVIYQDGLRVSVSSETGLPPPVSGIPGVKIAFVPES